MKRQTSGIAVSLLFGLLMLTSGCQGNSNAATKSKFFCGNAQYLGKNVPATIVHNPNSDRDFTIIIWKPDNYYFGNQWNPRKRCDQVSRRFQDIYDRDGLQYVTATVASWINDREVPVVCGVKSKSATCDQDDLLFTLETKDEPYAVLDDLMEIRQEWINLGNLPEDFREKGPKIIIILDNASYHKKKDVIATKSDLNRVRLCHGYPSCNCCLN